MTEKGNIVMPIEAFDALETILQSPDAGTNQSLSAFGYKWGEHLVSMLEEHCKLEELEQYLKQIAWEAGISKLELETTDESIHIHIKESGINNQYFLGGFLTGAISELLSTEDEQKQYGFEFGKGSKELSMVIKETSFTHSGEPEDDSPTKYPDIERGERYMVLEKEATDPCLSFDILKDLTHHGYNGLCMTTMIPTKAMESYGLNETNFVWLTDYRTGTQEFKEMNPKRLEFEISRDTRKFLSDNEKRILVIHGLEYLIRHNGFDKVAEFLDTIGRIVSASDNILICPIYPKALREIDYSNLKTIFKIIGDRP